MRGFRILLGIIFLVIFVYTVPVVLNDPTGLFPTFFGDMAQVAWPGQFNLDFLGFLVLSALWTMWRNEYSGTGIGLGVVAFFFGAPFLTAYLLFLSFKHDGDIKVMLLGPGRAAT